MSNCENCGSKVESKWEFCPDCGMNLRAEAERDLFSEIFERFGQEFAEMSKMFERQIEAMDITPMFKKSKNPAGVGFSINIVTSGNRPPEVHIQTFGDVDEKKLKKQVAQMVGSEQPLAMEEMDQSMEPVPQKEKRAKAPESMEEPKTKVQTASGKVFVEMELPSVKESDIEVNELESSVEVKAIAGKKAYFKILKKPENRKIIKTEFNKGVLKLEFN